MTAEQIRVERNNCGEEQWDLWGPYVSERAWGTVREDYSANGDAWNYFPHDHARSRVYRWNEDGIAGISDFKQRLCFAFTFWNERDAILKERFFGLTGPQGNHGEDVKEVYFYDDNTPSHSYMRMTYRYPRNAFPNDELVKQNSRRTRHQPEFELAHTGVFDGGCFEIEIEYAKRLPRDLLIRATITNESQTEAALHLLPTLWFRNTWSWGRDDRKPTFVRRASRAVYRRSKRRITSSDAMRSSAKKRKRSFSLTTRRTVSDSGKFRIKARLPRTHFTISSLPAKRMRSIRNRRARKPPRICAWCWRRVKHEPFGSACTK